MTIHIGNLTITPENAAQYAGVTEITGYAHIFADCPQLTKIGGYAYIRADCPALTSIGGGADIGTHCPQLTSIGGDAYISADCPQLTSIGGYAEIRADCPQLTSINGQSVAAREEALTRLQAVAVAALATPDALKMDQWHCGTSHCIAGWAETLFPDQARGDTATQATILLGAEAAPWFFKTDPEQDAEVRAWLSQFLPKQVPA